MSMRRSIGVVVTLLVTLTACGDDDMTDGEADGSTDEDLAELLGPEDAASGEPVRFGMISDGASEALDNTAELHAAEATVEYLNKHRGGVAGRPIELVTCETSADPGQAVDCANRMSEQEVVAVAIDVSTVAENVWEPLHAAGLPVMFFQATGSGLLEDPDSTFVLTNPFGGGVAMPVIVAQELGGEKVTAVVIDTPAGRTVYDSLAPSVFDQAGLEFDAVYIPPDAADLTSQMAAVAADDPDLVHVLGFDAFCISAFQGLAAAGYDGAISTFSGCVSDATREAVPTEVLDGMRVSSVSPLADDDDPSYQLFEAVVETYGEDVDVTDSVAIGAFSVVAGLATALEDISGDITPETVIETIKAMPEKELPGGGGVTFRCDGSAVSILPPVCSDQMLVTTLDEEGHTTDYEVVDLAPILDL